MSSCSFSFLNRRPTQTTSLPTPFARSPPPFSITHHAKQGRSHSPIKRWTPRALLHRQPIRNVQFTSSHTSAHASTSSITHRTPIRACEDVRDPDVLTCGCLVATMPSIPYIRKPGSPARRLGDTHDNRGRGADRSRRNSPSVSAYSVDDTTSS